ncbi:GFA family protein [Pantoea ananatis]
MKPTSLRQRAFQPTIFWPSVWFINSDSDTLVLSQLSELAFLSPAYLSLWGTRRVLTTFTGRCFCDACQFAVEIDKLNVHAGHCTLCQKRSGGIAIYIKAASAPA